MASVRSAHIDTFTADNLPPADQWPRFTFDLPELVYPETLNCGQRLLDDSAARFGFDRPCLIADEGTWTYGETIQRVDQVARVLVDDLGVVPGNRVLLRGPNTRWLAVAWLAVMKVGAVAVATMPLLRAGELRAIAEKGQVGLALCDHRYLDELAAADAGLEIVPYGATGADDLTTRAADKPTDFAAVDTAADDICMIAFTSGTTGAPKGCLHGHRDVLAMADAFSQRVIKPTPDDRFTGSPPLAFTFGLGQDLVFALRAGAAAVLLEQGSPPNLVGAIARHRVTVAATAPTAYRRMTGLEADLSSLRRCVSAGETLSASTWHAFRDRTGIEIIDGIGATEMLHIFISAADDDIRPGATGIEVPGYHARVLDDDGAPAPDGTVGRLAVYGPTGCRYLADPRQRTYVENGWNITGGAYIRDEDGYFWYQARADDMIISSGYNIAGPEVEGALMGHADVAEVAVVGAPDDERGQIVKAYVILREGATADPATSTALQDHVKQVIAPYKSPRAIEFIDALPKSQTGKLQRYRLREMASASS